MGGLAEAQRRPGETVRRPAQEADRAVVAATDDEALAPLAPRYRAERILPLGTYYTAIISFTELKGNLELGLVNHALCAAIRDMLKDYQTLVTQLEHSFKERGYKLVTDGTDNHMVLLDLKPLGLDGARVEAVLEQVNIACNKNTTPGDKSALTPCGIRIGAPAMTSRGMGEKDFDRIVGFIDQCIQLAKKVQRELPKEANKQKDFKAKVALGAKGVPEIAPLKEEIAAWAGTFPLPV